MTTPDQPGRVRGAIFFLTTIAASLGVPAGVAKLFQLEIAAHPFVALFALFIYEVCLLVIGLSARVGEILAKRWAERLAGLLDRNLQIFFSRYLRRYLLWIFYQHRDFDVKGLTTQGIYNLELEQVFVDLTIEPKPAHATSADPIRPMPLGLAGRRQIWDFLKEKKLTNNFVLIGPPGSGKTTLLKKISLQMTGSRSPSVRQTIPILLFLREHADIVASNPNYSLAEAVKSSLSRKEGPPAPDHWFETKLRNGRCLILLDGLDEVAKVEVRQRIVTWIEDRMKAHPKNRFLITSRPHGYRSNPISGVTVLEVQPFNRSQVEKFVYNWYSANEIRASGKNDAGVKMKAKSGSIDLLQRLTKSQTLIGLAVNPLLLTMIATVHRFRSSLPGRRVELYAEICEVFLGKRQQARDIAMELTPAQRQLALQPLAYYLMQNKRREISLQEAVQIVSKPLSRIAGSRFLGTERDFLQEIENGSGLLLERELEVYSFAHLAFQEYLAAVHAREEGIGEALARQVTDPWWNETIRLYCAQEDASPILEACLAAERPAIAALALAIDCLEEARDVDPKWREQVEGILTQGIEDQDPQRFYLAAEAFLSRRLRDLAPMKDGVFVDLTYITNAEYQLFLDEEAATGHYHQPDHWAGRRFPTGAGQQPVLGIRRSDAQALCAWLNNRDSLYNYRLPWPEELKKYKLDEPRPPQAERAEGYWTSDSGHSFERFRQSQNKVSNATMAGLIHLDLISPQIQEETNSLIYEYALETAKGLATDLERKTIAIELDMERPLMLDKNLEAFQSVVGNRAVTTTWALRQVLEQATGFSAIESEVDEALTLIEKSSRSLNTDITQSLAISKKIIELCGRAYDLAKQQDDELAAQSSKKLRRIDSLKVALGHSQGLAQSLGRTIALSYALRIILTRTYTPDTHSLINWCLRVFMLDMVLYARDIPEFSRSLLAYESYRQVRLVKEKALPLYADLLLLEARIDGSREAFEGVRIVREKKSSSG
ncbi:MAG TPA: NACHT domain-containing protein [Thermoanaerobaculia bacterium]|nr:NACHT domain-containing protein [Thermoanaerobaculia bacterium]